MAAPNAATPPKKPRNSACPVSGFYSNKRSRASIYNDTILIFPAKSYAYGKCSTMDGDDEDMYSGGYYGGSYYGGQEEEEEEEEGEGERGRD